MGHLGHCDEYQLDVESLVDLGRQLKLPEPWTILGHSMGGCIELHALYNGLPVKGAAFTGPLWGIKVAPPTASDRRKYLLGRAQNPNGDGPIPGTKQETYLSISLFKDNMLIKDVEMYGYMTDQAKPHPELTLSGTTLDWLYAALRETQDLMSRPAPTTHESIVQPEPIHTQMAKWSNGALVLVKGAEHEILMEAKAVRQQVYDALGSLQTGVPIVAPVSA